MRIEKTKFEGLFLIHPRIFPDQRGYFFESFNKKVFSEETGLLIDFVQDNEALSTYGVLRGLHYQLPPMAQSKLVRVINGKVLDVVVDIRKESPTFGQHFSCELSGDNKLQLFVPKGFAHGYVVLSEQAIFAYKCDQYYSQTHERGIFYADEGLAIDWKVPLKDQVISTKDKEQLSFNKIDPFF